MSIFKVSVFTYPIGSDDWKLRHSFYFNAEKLEMEKDGEYYTVRITASELPLEHYQKNERSIGCRKAEQSVFDYASVEGNTYTFPKVQSVDFKGVWD